MRFMSCSSRKRLVRCMLYILPRVYACVNNGRLAVDARARQIARMRTLALVGVLSAIVSLPAQSPRPTLSSAARAFVAIDTPVVALTHARVIDGTGAAP